MIISDFTPQEVCVMLKLCSDDNPPRKAMINEDNIHQVTGPSTEVESYEESPQCVICEFIIDQLMFLILSEL